MSVGDDRDRTDRSSRANPWDDGVDRHTAEALRRALAREAARVVPSGDGLDLIRARTTRTRHRSSWLVPLAAAAASVAVIGGAGWAVSRDGVDAPSASEEQTSGLPVATGPGGGDDPNALPPPALEGTAVALPVYYVGEQGGDGQPDEYRLFREFHPTTTAETPDAETRVELALREMFAASAADPNYHAAMWPRSADVRAVLIDDAEQLITVDLTGLRASDLSAGPHDPRSAPSVQQLVFTATAAASIGAPVDDGSYQVQILVDGERVEYILETATSEPLSRDTAASRAAVWILSLDEGDTVTNPVTITGEANRPADDISGWEILRDGAVVSSGEFATDRCCTWAPFSFTLDDTTLTPGSYELRVFVMQPDGPLDSKLKDSKTFSIEGPAS